MKKSRLDALVFERGLTESRERAKSSIMAGLVYVDGVRSDKPGAAVSPEAVIELRGETTPYVSRGGLKLEKALRVFGVDPEGEICIDCGASTGGFTDVLLQNGAKRVYAVDVGYGQLAWKLRSDERVVVMERTNVRLLTPDKLPEKPSLAVMDLSFISLRLVLPPVRELLTENGRLVCLIKPQFEAGRERVGKNGVVREKSTHIEVLSDFVRFAGEAGLILLGLDYSPVRGPAGNIEYLAFLQKGAESRYIPDFEGIVSAAHEQITDSGQITVDRY
ncbi:MAG: TlyA family RNA methyltransferase [Oscillospiraceae bacterium]|jgi:23S rRNA (cytidine1920-2'-O)/16S rRNA (cytidine1409-2'-O)-methyltransferase|nr:TlyA family RNA methyltransferase [Oscillospiraceae bacterium]